MKIYNALLITALITSVCSAEEPKTVIETPVIPKKTAKNLRHSHPMYDVHGHFAHGCKASQSSYAQERFPRKNNTRIPYLNPH